MKGLLRVMGARLPQLSGTLRAPVRDRVTVRRDANGVAYVEAQNDHDAFFGLGFAQGQDRAFQIDLYARIARGTLSELVGPEMLGVDRLSRRLGFLRIASAQVALLSAERRADFDAFAAGVTHGIASSPTPHELALLNGPRRRYEAVDILAILHFFAFALSSNWDAELARLRVLQADGPEALEALEYAEPSLVATEAGTCLVSDAHLLAAAEKLAADAARATSTAGAGGASNNWVLATARTATGRPLLASDPHLGPTIPAPWYLAHVRTPQWGMTGAFFPGQPVPPIGHNETLAWGLTAGHADNTDLFVERLGPDGATALRGGAFVTCETRDEVIKVKGRPDIIERLVTTANGPVVTPLLRAGGAALSLRGTWMAARSIESYGLYRATTVAEARELFRVYPALSENRVFADVHEDIAWQMTGDVPVRKKGHGLLPMPGWDESAGWESEPRPYEQLPSTLNPARGFCTSANAAPESPDHVFLSADWLEPGRRMRIVELLDARHDWDVEKTQAMQVDRVNVHWRAVREPLLAALTPDVDGTGETVRYLREWNGEVGPESIAASIFETLFAELMCRVCQAKAPRAWRSAAGEGINVLLAHGMNALRRTPHLVRLLNDQPAGWFPRPWRDEIREALKAALDGLRARRGPNPRRWQWGDVRPLTLEHALGKAPVIGRLFNVGPLSFGGDASTLPQASLPFAEPFSNPVAIPNMRVVMDVGNWERSRWVIAGGQSGNPVSAHYADQIPLWLTGRGVEIAWSPDSVTRSAVATLDLVK